MINRAVTKEEGQQLANTNGLLFFEISSKTKENALEALQETAYAAMRSQLRTLQEVNISFLGEHRVGKVCIQKREKKNKKVELS